ncbi:MAG: fructose-specific PTS transporter subunit EIIC [Aerococcus sp.]|nr:fructose-specific PTS transporter subunit EIIC [Aerococcus sp.]
MQLSDLFVKSAMVLDLETQTKDETLRLLAERFANSGGVSDVDAFVGKLKKREEESTTGVGDEIAIPHAQHESIKEAAIIFARSQAGIDWASFDGQPVKYIFMIAAPAGASNDHLKALAKLSQVLMKPEVKGELAAANTPDDIVAIFKKYAEEDEEKITSGVTPDETEDKATNYKGTVDDDAYLLGVTACPTGIAHTYMAEERLKQAAKVAGVPIKVETNGQGGIEHRLTAADIEKASAIIVAADKQVEMARFNGKPTIIVPVSDGVNKADQLVDQALHGDVPIYHAKGQDDSMAQLGSNDTSSEESAGRRIYKHLMNGVSHMLPFVVAGGILIALSFFWGIYSADPKSDQFNPIAQSINTIGNLSFAMMLPILAGYIGESMADRTGLVIGFMGGVFANAANFSAYSQTGVFENAIASGFLGALVAGFLSGWIVKFLQWAFQWLPKSLNGMKSIFLYPVFGVLIMGVIMLFVVNGPMGAVMNALISFINSIPSEATVLLGFVVAGMMSIDMGGPINKAAYVTGTALVTASGAAGSNVMASVMVGGMVPPLAIAIAATIRKNLWMEEERQSAYVNYAMGAAFITEGAIPFAAKDPLHVIPPLFVGAGVAGAMSAFFDVHSLVPHGGVFAAAVGGVTHPWQFLLSWIVGGIIGALLLNSLRRRSQLNPTK